MHQRSMRKIVVATVVAVSGGFSLGAHARTFQVEGSDLLMGVGAASMAKSGAVVANSNDAYSMYWNPAGLAAMSGNEITVSRQLNAKLIKNNFIGLAFAGDTLSFGNYQTAIGFAWLPRLHMAANGNFRSDEFESIFIRYALPSLPEDFDGEVESKTRDKRVVFAISPKDNARWRLGVAVGRINCGTKFCGVFANDPGNYTVASVEAKATTLGVGAQYRVNERVQLGLNVKDVDTRLEVVTVVTDKDGTETKRVTTGFPRTITVGGSWQRSAATVLTTDLESMLGRYGNSSINVTLLRAGLETRSNQLAYRMGMIVPLVMKSDTTQSVREDMPAPFLPTAGIGWHGQYATIDFVIYPHPVMSYTEREIRLASDLTLSLRW